MERTIKFRGKRVGNVEWVYGMPLTYRDGHVAIYDGLLMLYGSEATTLSRYKVDPATVGQFTGLKDKNGKDVFEGDLLNVSTNCAPVEVTFQHGAFCIGLYGWHKLHTGAGYASIEVIGNIHEEQV